MSGTAGGAGFDCEVHVPAPPIKRLMPFFDDRWQDAIVARGIHGFPEVSVPPNAPFRCRPDWRAADGTPGGDVAGLTAEVLDRRGMAGAILACLYPVQLVHDAGMAAAFARAVNSVVAEDWLDRDPRLRGSILIAPQDPEYAVAEIERLADDRRFVQVLMLAGGDLPYGHPLYRPIFEAAVRHDLPVALHAGTAERYGQTASGWATYHYENYVDHALAFQGQVASLVTHGVFSRFPELRIVLLESGISWLPAFAWRLSKFWRGTRIEVPWIRRAPVEIIRDHVRLTLRPLDAPGSAPVIDALLDRLGSEEMILYASDYPHWHFDGDDPLPAALGPRRFERFAIDNPQGLYRRMGDAA